jgi:hypothetical protein
LRHTYDVIGPCSRTFTVTNHINPKESTTKAKIATALLIAIALLIYAVPVRAEYTYNRALQLDGNGDYVEVDTSLTNTTLLAVEAWNEDIEFWPGTCAELAEQWTRPNF